MLDSTPQQRFSLLFMVLFSDNHPSRGPSPPKPKGKDKDILQKFVRILGKLS